MKSWFAKLTLACCLAGLFAATLPGCNGCRPEDPLAKKRRELEEEKKKKQKDKEKPKPDFEVGQLRIQPSDGGVDKTMVKPGHWVAATTLMKANNFDFPAELESTTVNSSQRPYDVEHTRFHLMMSRPAALPKGQTMQFETVYFVPHGVPREQKQVMFETKLRGSRGGREQAGGSQGVVQMPPHQYLLLVLSATPDSFKFDELDSVRPVLDDIDNTDNNIHYYRVVRPKLEGRMPLPTNSLTWTSIAYLFWDDVDPTQLSADQQHALLDWLHFGGQLIVNGPSSLDRLKGSFLSEYLPADKVRSINLDQAAFDELNEHWSLVEKSKKNQRRPLAVVPDKPPLGLELKLLPGGSFVNDTGSLLAERRVGRGRVAVTAISLVGREMKTWPGFDGFLNGCLLRRPARNYEETNYNKPKAVWAGNINDQGPRYNNKDPRLVTALRYFSRDVGHTEGGANAEPTAGETTDPTGLSLPPGPNRPDEELIVTHLAQVSPEAPVEIARPGGPAAPETAKETKASHESKDPRLGGFHYTGQSGIAGWNDFSGAADAARSALKDAAGISIPKAGFVLRVLGVYLFVLVPLNWGFFRLIGRVEWAWIAAPLIAIVGAVAVVRMAQLDIGFARSRTDIAIVEAHGDYPRAHLTRYSALYTSLSSGYELTFDDPFALAQPFALDIRYDRPRTETSLPVYFRRDKQVSLRGFQVDSNTTGMVHCEQMFNLGGVFHLTGGEGGPYVVDNKTDIAIKDAAVLRRNALGEVQVAWIGNLASKTSAPITFQAPSEGKMLWLPQWETSPATARSGDSHTAGVSMWRLIDLACNGLGLAKGEVRLIGWTDHEVPGLAIRPSAAQTTRRTLVLAHLRHADLPPAQPDLVAKDDVQETKENTERDLDLSPAPPPAGANTTP